MVWCIVLKRLVDIEDSNRSLLTPNCQKAPLSGRLGVFSREEFGSVIEGDDQRWVMLAITHGTIH